MKLRVWLHLDTVKSETWEISRLHISAKGIENIHLYGRMEVEPVTSHISPYHWVLPPGGGTEFENYVVVRFESKPGISPFEVHLSGEEAERLLQQLQAAVARHHDGPTPEVQTSFRRSQAMDSSVVIPKEDKT